MEAQGGEENLWEMVTAAYRRLRKDFREIGTNGQINRFVGNHVAQMGATADGWVKPRTNSASAGAEAKVTGVIAGGGFVTSNFADAIWERFAAATGFS